MAKKGGSLVNMFTAGIGAYAAKKSGSISELLVTLLKYSVVIIGILLAVSIVARLLGATERFSILPNSPTDPRYPGVAVAPSESQESGYVKTGAGNVYRT